MVSRDRILYAVLTLGGLAMVAVGVFAYMALEGVGGLPEQSDKHRRRHAGAEINAHIRSHSANAADVSKKDAGQGVGRFDRADNGVWMRRHWIHGGADLDHGQLAKSLDQLGIRRVYPFLGPMPAQGGRPGWRGDGKINPYEPKKARRFFTKMKRLAPNLAIVPWTGGVLTRDAHPGDPGYRKAFAAQMATLVELGADGVHLNVEPLPSFRPGYLRMVRRVKAAIGPDKTLSIAAYPPTTELHPFEKVHWTLGFTRMVCKVADELVVMAYDTALEDPATYEGLMADWTDDLLDTLPAPDDGGCQVLMGVPAYEDDEPYHRPDVENIAHGIQGVLQGLDRRDDIPEHFRGIAVYSSWTTDADEWATYQRLWRGREAEGVVLPDFPRKQ